MEPWITLRRRDLDAERPDGVIDSVHFAERLAEKVIAAFSVPGDLVLDPFSGFGTTAAVAVRIGRRAMAVELLADRAEYIRRRAGTNARVINGDARELSRYVREPVKLCLTSPPYMTRTGHPENPMTGYRTLDGSYATYLEELESVFSVVATLLEPGGHLVINAASTIGVDGITPFADDLAHRVSPYLERRPDLPIGWDETAPGILDDRCLVFQKPS